MKTEVKFMTPEEEMRYLISTHTMSKPHCGECNFFKNESIDGYGWCDVAQREQL